MDGQSTKTAARRLDVMITAAEAFPVFERCVLDAREQVSCSFRVFDPWTPLYSDEGRAVGCDWFDLIVHTLARGVRFTVIITDFDPVIRPDDHRATWRSIHALIAAGEASGRMDLLDVQAAMHAARVGLLPRLPLWPRLLGEIREKTDQMNAMSQDARDRSLTEMPGLHPWIAGEGSNLRPRRWPVPPLVPATHHQKIAVFDRELAYIGGLDLNERRYDDPLHQRDGVSTWHDVQLLVDGQTARDAQAHIDSFQDITEGETPPILQALLRTTSRKRTWDLPYLSPVPVLTELVAAHRREAAGARKLIYLESQFFRDTKFARQLVRLSRRYPDLSVILILPAAPEEVAFEDGPKSDSRYGEYLQAKSVDILRKGFGERLFIGSPALPTRDDADDRSTLYGSPLIYVHAKVSIFDEHAAIVGSANLNGRSFRWDTEAGVEMHAPEEVRQLKERCFTHWLGVDTDASFFEMETAVGAWNARARENVRAAPSARQGFILPYASRPAQRFGRNLPGIPEEMV